MPENIDNKKTDKQSGCADDIINTVYKEKYNTCLKHDGLSIKFTNKNLMEALIYSEVLGRPRCKRRGRWR